MRAAPSSRKAPFRALRGVFSRLMVAPAAPVIFCPARVYETIYSKVKPANPSNCLHSDTCQRKCPFDNIRWTAPEGGGPRYKRM